VLDTLVITLVGHVGHYCCWTGWSLLLLDTLVITLVGHVGHYCFGHVGHYCFGHVGHYCCWALVLGYSCWNAWFVLLESCWNLSYIYEFGLVVQEFFLNCLKKGHLRCSETSVTTSQRFITYQKSKDFVTTRRKCQISCQCVVRFISSADPSSLFSLLRCRISVLRTGKGILFRNMAHAYQTLRSHSLAYRLSVITRNTATEQVPFLIWGNCFIFE